MSNPKTEVRVIEGQVDSLVTDDRMSSIVFFPSNGFGAPTGGYCPASLVVGDTSMPMSEARKMLEEIRTAPGLLGETSWTIQTIAARYGITNL